MRRIALLLTAGLLLAAWQTTHLSAAERGRRSFESFVDAIRKHDCEFIRQTVARQPSLLQRLSLGRLQSTVEACDPATLICLIELGLTCTATDTDGRTLFHWAAINRRRDLIPLLLERGADPNLPDRNGSTPTHMICLQGDPQDLQAMLDAGGDPTRRDQTGSGMAHYTMIHTGNPAMMQLLSDRQCPLDMPNNAGLTPIMQGCLSMQQGLPAPIAILPLTAASTAADRAAGIRFLIDRKVNLHRTDTNNHDVLHYAILGNQLQLAAACIAAGVEIGLKDNNGLTPLDFALVLHCTPEMIELFTRQRAPAPYTDPLGNNHLHMRVAAYWAAPPNSAANQIILSQSCDPAVPLLLAGGFDPNAVNNAGQTALHRACEGTNFDSATVLLQYGADPNRATNAGVRPLDIAAARHDLNLLRLLLEHGADPQLTDAAGLTTLERQLTIGPPAETRERLAQNGVAGIGFRKYQDEIRLLYSAQHGLPLTCVWIGLTLGLIAAAQGLRLRAARLKHAGEQGVGRIDPPSTLWHGVDWKKRIGQFEQARRQHAEQLRLRAWPWVALGALAAAMALHGFDPLLVHTTPEVFIPPFTVVAGVFLLMQTGMYWNHRAVRAWLAAVGLTAVGVLALLLGFNGYAIGVQMGFWSLGLLLAMLTLPMTAAAWAYYRILVIDRAILAVKLPGDLHATPLVAEAEDIESHHDWDERGKTPVDDDGE